MQPRGPVGSGRVCYNARVSDASSTHNTAGEQSRRYGIRDGACQAIMQGGGENYLSAFALLLHATPLQIGLLSAATAVAAIAVRPPLGRAMDLHGRRPLILRFSARLARSTARW